MAYRRAVTAGRRGRLDGAGLVDRKGELVFATEVAALYEIVCQLTIPTYRDARSIS